MTTMKTCLKCGFESAIEDSPMAECPKCGAIYSRVEEAFSRKAANEAERLRKADAQRARTEAADLIVAERNAKLKSKLFDTPSSTKPLAPRLSGMFKFGFALVFGVLMFAVVMNAGNSRTDHDQSNHDAAVSSVDGIERQKAKAAEEELRCRHNEKCWAEHHMGAATLACREPIQHFAKWDFQWTDSWMDEGIFDRYVWEGNSSQIIYLGDKLKLQNGFGAWKHVNYKCVFDIDANREISVEVFDD